MYTVYFTIMLYYPPPPHPPHTGTPTRDASAVNAPTMHNHTALATPSHMIKYTPSGVASPPPPPPPTANCGKVRLPTGRAERSEAEKNPNALRGMSRAPRSGNNISHRCHTERVANAASLCFSPPSFCCH